LTNRFPRIAAVRADQVRANMTIPAAGELKFSLSLVRT
jgi:hypothetical protein